MTNWKSIQLFSKKTPLWKIFIHKFDKFIAVPFFDEMPHFMHQNRQKHAQHADEHHVQPARYPHDPGRRKPEDGMHADWNPHDLKPQVIGGRFNLPEHGLFLGGTDAL